MRPELQLASHRPDEGRAQEAGVLALNPMGQIPVLVDSEGPGGKKVTMAQSSAIMMYCAEKAGKFIPKDGAKRAAMLEAYMSASTDITPMFGSVNCLRARQGSGALRAGGRHVQGPPARLLQGLERHARQAQVRGRRRADDRRPVALRRLLAHQGRVPELLQGFSNLERWGGEMAARPGIQKATKL
jgi:GST-like protein